MSGGAFEHGSASAPGPEPSSTRLLLDRVGFGYFPLALIARLPFAMMVIGVLTLVVSARGSVQLGGLNSAMAGIGVAAVGPLIGAAADRFGQRPALLIVAVANSIVLGAFAWIAFSPLPDWVMLATAFIIGATTPQVSPMSRSRLVLVIANDIPVVRRPRLLSGTLAYESAADELVFIFGPVIVGLVATLFGAAAPVIAAAILTLFFVAAFALHRTSAPAKTARERAETLAPASELVRPALLMTVLGTFGVGLFFGSMLTSLTSFMQDRGAAEQAGLIYGAMGVGSAVLALSVALLPPRFTLRWRWIVFALLIVIGGIVLQFVGGVAGMVFALTLMGCGTGPSLVNLFSFGAMRSPEGRSATVMTMLGSAISVGQSAGAWAAGAAAEQLSTAAALALPLISALIVLVTGAVNWWLTPSGRNTAGR